MKRGAVLLFLLGAAAACGMSRLPAPSYTGHPTSALVEVPYPPPPAHIESIPKQPDGRVVWLDGEWVWKARAWAWKPGRWVAPPNDAKFAPWTAVRDQTGVLYVATGVWRDRSGAALEDPKPLKTGRVSATAVIDNEGDSVSPAPVLSYDAGVPEEMPPNMTNMTDGGST